MADFIFDATEQSGWVLDGRLPANPPAFAPAGYKFDTFPGRGENWIGNPGLTIVSGTVQMTALWLPGLQAGYTEPLTKLAFMTGNTAGATMTHWWLALCDLANARVLAVTADQTTAAIAANSLVPVNTTASFVPPYSGLYYLALMVAATTPPTLHSFASTSNMNGLAPILCGTSSAGQTTAPALQSLLAAPTAGNNFFYGCAG